MASELSQAAAAIDTLQPRADDSSQRALSIVPDDLRALQAVVEGTAAGVGREFFRCLVRQLAEAIDVQYAAACEFLTPPKGRVLAFWERDHVVEDLDFDFTTSPASEVLTKDFAHFPAGVLERFPDARFLAQRNVEGYMAVPFVNSKGDVVGFLSVFDQRPMPEEPRRLFIMQIFAARAAAEFERLQAEQRLHESESRYRDLFENAPNAYWVVSTEGHVISANHRAGELLGYPLDEIIGAPTVSFGADTPAGKPRILEVRRKHLAGESVFGLEMELRRKDGQPAWIKVWMVPGRGEDGTITTARAFGVDITDRVMAETERARLQEQNVYLREEIKADHNFEQIIGRSSALCEVLDQVARVATTDATVLIAGETGTGKELIARAVHSASQRHGRPLIKVNCAALPANLVESELFGHEKGAFSGAIARRPGRFELAQGGTIFLDEIGELPMEAQVKLLRVLQEREFDRVGGTAPIRIDVRVIAATNRDLAAEVREKRFREDLYFRLNVFPIHLPPLRGRRDDIELLTQFLVKKFASRLGKTITQISRATIERFQQYRWPGNIRELENLLERALILANGPTLDVVVDLAMPTAASNELSNAPEVPNESERKTSTSATAERTQPTLEEVERDYILNILRETNGVITGPRGAAGILGLHPSTLRSRIKKLGISRA